ncbi:MAG: precorrin-4 C(11)-methyltransferase [Deltaproteobacteria bacterium]|jgi:precorrin-4/cobalt-precorrin-4 C11-methyltransferase|nr:precorrin-4 C(11)-methyltransferase [Deltaproteobacteria bacterium]MBT4527607.1 precorrin-4 C(11)-methyltransferase [Deltaproteobacteria bacterium]
MIYFIGAGPGDEDLITVKGRRIIEAADLVVFTGSLVSKTHLKYCKPDCVKISSAPLTLEEVMDKLIEFHDQNLTVVRLHTGDPSIYGAIGEQIKILDERKIDFEVVPGVSSFTAACSSLKKEFTLPGISQTVIVTRLAGRTPVPEKEDLELLARHQCSMAIFLSVKDMKTVVKKLTAGYGSDQIPIAVVYKATWPDEKIIKGTLADIAEKVAAHKIEKFAQILVGEFIDTDFDRSLLYHPEFTHDFRKGNQ